MGSSNFDFAVIGAGPSGSAIARRLSLYGYSVVLIERSHFDKQRVGESLAPAVQPLLNDLGVWQEFIALNPIPSFGTRSIWGNELTQEHSHIFNPYGSGWHVDRCAFDRMLAQAAVSAGVELQCGLSLRHCERVDKNYWLLYLRSSGSGQLLKKSQELNARVVIDATGRGSYVSKLFGAQQILFDRLVGVTAIHNNTKKNKENFILLESTPTGWWYSAPISFNKMMVMFMTDSDICNRDNLSTSIAFKKLFAAASATFDRLDSYQHEAPKVFSAKSQRIHRVEQNEHWLAVGDAALAVDPISGSGVVRALRSAQIAVETAVSIVENQTRHTIKLYENKCDSDCNKYLHERSKYYEIENRWQQYPFWQRRIPNLAKLPC